MAAILANVADKVIRGLDVTVALLFLCAFAAIGYKIWEHLGIRRQMKRGYIIKARVSPEVFFVTYTEKGQSLRLSGDPETLVVQVPPPLEWMNVMPGWARERRDEILSRIRQHYRKGRFKLAEDRR